MSILVDETTRVVVQGLGRAGRFHAEQCIKFGANIVAGVHPGRGGSEVLGFPVFDTMREAVVEAHPNASLAFVPASGAADAALEAIEAEIALVACITEGIPTRDMVRVADALRGSATRLIGPNCPGVISPGKCKLGIMPGAHPQTRIDWGRLTLRHADLRGRRATLKPRHWPIDMHRDWGRSDYRNQFHRCAGDV